LILLAFDRQVIEQRKNKYPGLPGDIATEVSLFSEVWSVKHPSHNPMIN